MSIVVAKFKENATIPTRGSEEAAGVDLYACIDKPITLLPRAHASIGTGIIPQLKKGTFGAVFARSGLACKHGCRPVNCVGVVDSDYRGEIKVEIINDYDEPYTIQPDERIAQMVIIPCLMDNVIVANNLSKTERQDKGFGSTGK